MTIKNDIFIINNTIWLGPILEEAGITWIGSSCVSASGAIWFEEEGLDIRAAKLVIVVVNEDFFKEEPLRWGVNVAIHNKKKILLFFEGEEYKTAFYKIWNREQFFGEYMSRSDLLEAIQEEQYLSDTASGNMMKINFYVKSLLFNDALSECHTLLNKCREDERKLPVALLKLAEINFLLENYSSFEKDLLDAIQAFKDVQVIWGSDNALYCEKLLIEYYRASDQTDKMELAEARIQGKRFFGFTEEDVQKAERQYMQKVKLFYERSRRKQDMFRKKREHAATAESNVTHQLIVNYIKASVELFDKLSKNGITDGFDACLKESYERLAEYCKLINDAETERLCVDKIYDIDSGNCDFALMKNDETDFDIKCIKTFLGKVVPDSEMFDVFVSHKSHDTELAENIYRILQKNGKEVFLDRISLPMLGDAEYRNSILKAIDNSSHMVIVCSNLKYLQSKWVSQEYNLFCDEIREGRKSGNIILVFTEDVCAEVFRTNKTCLPIQLRSFEIIPYQEIESKLPKYIY